MSCINLVPFLTGSERVYRDSNEEPFGARLSQF